MRLSMPLSDRGKYRNTWGILTLGGGRLVFTRTDGFLSKTERIVISIPVDAIHNINVEGFLGKKLVILVDNTRIPGIPRHEFEVGDPIYWTNMIRNEMVSSIAARDNQIQPMREVYIKEINREIVKVPCRYCGSLNVMTDKKCSSCGAPIN
jgi:hypothetical protein